MRFNRKNIEYLREVGAVLIKSSYKIELINFSQLKAYVNKIDTYKKRNGKLCNLEHHFGRWIPFTKNMISYGQKTQKGITDDWSVADREEYEYKKTVKYLSKENRIKIIESYFEK